MPVSNQRIIDRHPQLRDAATRRQMLVRNAVGSARVEGIEPDEARLQQAVAATLPGAVRPQ